ncbi:MAG: hypothetical protein ACRC33_04855 [Gemmataceae bacterium]
MAVFAVTSLFWAWVLFGRGADWLEGSVLASLFVDTHAIRWTADGIKLFAGLTWAIGTVWFAVGLAVPEARLWW